MDKASPLDADIGFLLSRGAAVSAREANRVLAPCGVKVRSYSLLALAAEAPGGVAQRQIAATLSLDPSQVVAMVDELESAGMVERTQDPADRRNKLVSATDAGRELHRDAAERVMASRAPLLAGFTSDEVDVLRALLRRIAFADNNGR